MAGLKMPELLLILVAVLVLFGGTRLPQLGSGLGQAIRNFKKGFSGDDAPEAQPDGKSLSGPNATAQGVPPSATRSNKEV